MLSTAQPTCFLIADISGYTGYLADVELDHAQDILADLIGAVVSALRPDFRLAKLEGDAAFMSMVAETVDGSMLLDTIERCYFGFRRRRRDVRQATSCECNACVRIPDLDLKFVVHHGEAIQQKVAGRQELLGSDVIVVHRLLKNEVVEGLGMPAYALISQACIDASDLDPAALGMRAHTETYDRIGEVADLGPRPRADAGRRKRRASASSSTPEASILIVSVETDVPPQVAWEFITKPGQRMSWQPWVTEVTVAGATGGRRGPGSANHCMHGKDAVVEEILDWRPYDYVTDRTVLDDADGTDQAAPHRGVRARSRPARRSTSGTRRRGRSGRRSSWRSSARPTAAALESGLPSLVAQLDAELAAREADRGPEPELARPRADGPLSGLEPLVIVG